MTRPKQLVCVIIASLAVVTMVKFYLNLDNPSYRPIVRMSADEVRNAPDVSVMEEGSERFLDHKNLRVIILGYMHTGSTFLGSVLQQRPGTFYEYEPIRSNMVESKSARPLSFLNGTTRYLTSKEKRLITGPQRSWFGDFLDTDFETEMLQHRLRCEHNRLDLASLGVLYHSITSLVNRDRKEFMECQHHLKEKNEKERFDKNLTTKCLPLLTKRCEKADTIVHKYIRAHVNITERLLETFSNLKVIHLVRDPRAFMDSQSRKNDMDSMHTVNFTRNAMHMCARVRSDLEHIPRVKERFGNRIMMVRQEELLDHPLEIFQSIFKFLGLDLTPADISRIPPPGNKLPTWRKHISSVNLKAVDKYCQDLYSQLGYIKFDSVLRIRQKYYKTYFPFNESNLILT